MCSIKHMCMLSFVNIAIACCVSVIKPNYVFIKIHKNLMKIELTRIKFQDKMKV